MSANYVAALRVENAVEVTSFRRLGGAIAEDIYQSQADVLMGWAESSYSDRAVLVGRYVEEFGYADAVIDFLNEMRLGIEAAKAARTAQQ